MTITPYSKESINNINTLESILCNKNSGIKLLDNCLFSDYNISRILHDALAGNINNKNLSFYNIRINRLFECVNLHDENITVPEIIDSEMFNLRKLLKDKRHYLINNFPYRKSREMLFFKKTIKDLEEIEITLEALTYVLSNNENYCLFIQGNQFDREIYQKYELFVSKLFNKFKPEHARQENICADDGLVAASIILLKKLKKQVSIISNDSGVVRRISIFNAFVSYSKEHDYFYEKMHNLLMSVGVSMYSNLTKKRMYHLFGKTNNNSLTYDLKIDDKSTAFFYEISDEINSLEQRYGKLFLKNAV